MDITGEVFGMARIGLGLERDEMAERLGVSLRTVANWEKNGVPSHRNALVMSKIGKSIRGAQAVVERNLYFNSPEGMAEMEADHAAGEARNSARSAAVFLDGNDSAAVQEFMALKDLLAPYSTAGLLREISRRVALADLDAVLASHRAGETAAKADPDYSQMSDQDAKDYGLAAYRGEENIGHDDIPHEP